MYARDVVAECVLCFDNVQLNLMLLRWDVRQIDLKMGENSCLTICIHIIIEKIVIFIAIKNYTRNVLLISKILPLLFSQGPNSRETTQALIKMQKKRSKNTTEHRNCDCNAIWKHEICSKKTHERHVFSLKRKHIRGNNTASNMLDPSRQMRLNKTDAIEVIKFAHQCPSHRETTVTDGINY